MNNDKLKRNLDEVKSIVDVTAKNVAAQTNLSKHKFSFSNQSFSEQLIIWDYIWHNALDDWTRMQSFVYLESYIKDKNCLVDSWEIIKHWQNKVDNWGDCDALSRIYTKVLEIIPNEVLGQLEQWNKSTNPWDRRQSLVSLLYFSRTKKVVLPYNTIINFIDSLINDPEYYVQKAVGWSIKESYNVYPNETLQYLNENINRVSAIAFTAAIEKLKKEDKERLKGLRKLNRQY